jgi:hypothetical protein
MRETPYDLPTQAQARLVEQAVRLVAAKDAGTAGFLKTATVTRSEIRAEGSQHGSRTSLTMTYIKESTSHVAREGERVSGVLGTGVATGKTMAAQTRQLGAAIYHELLHADLATKNPASSLVQEFERFSAAVQPGLREMQTNIDKFVDSAVSKFSANGSFVKAESVARTKASMAEFLANESFVFGKEEKAFGHARGQTSLEGHLRMSIDAKMQELFQSGKPPSSQTDYDAVQASSAYKGQIDALATQAAATVRKPDEGSSK